MRLTPWDRKSAGLAAGLACLTVLVALLVIAATDDGASWARRAAMLGAVTPVAGAIGTLGALRLARSRGEFLALFSVGVRPWRAFIGAILGGIAVALPGPFLAASPWADQGALFPAPQGARVWVSSYAPGAGVLRELTMGLELGSGGRITFLAAKATSQPAPPRPVELVFCALLLCAIACPSWIAARASSAHKAATGSVALVLLIASFQGAATERVSPVLLLVAPLLLLADVAFGGYAALRRAPMK